MLKVDGLTAVYGRKTVLADIRFALSPGDWLMVVGPNGAGKSTLLRAIAQSIPHAGRVRLLGREVEDMSPQDLSLIHIFPFAIVALNLLIAVASDFESGIKGAQAMTEFGDRWWLSSENVWLYGGWWNWLNGIAGIVNILCMTGWWGIYSSKKQEDMLWPDMIWLYILAYDLWNFEYTYLNLPTHA